jgi:transcriptional regulator with XRE-family HTH domain
LGDWTQASVARLFGISRERVSQILDKKNVKPPCSALRKARKEWREKVTASFGEIPTIYENL